MISGYSRAEASQFQFVITLFTALVSAFLSTIVSQPGDTLVSKMTKAKKASVDGEQLNIPNELEVLTTILQEEGVKGLFVGIQARMLHVAFFVSVQLLVYDYVKQLCGIPPTGMTH